MAKQKLKGPRKLSNAAVKGGAADAIAHTPAATKAKVKLPRKKARSLAQAGPPRDPDARPATKRALKAKVKSPGKKKLVGPVGLDPVTAGDLGLLGAGAQRRAAPRPGRSPGRLERLEAAIDEVRSGLRTSPRTRKLLSSGVPKMAQKVIEEAAETAIEAIRGDRVAFVLEMVDLFYNLVALCSELGIPIAEIWAEMDRRERDLGMAEKTPKGPDAAN